MIEVCETIMLICFGLSWPISLIRNIKSKSANGMNLQFTLLIIFGYVAGITAKILGGQFNFVFAMYILNILVVSCNVVVYFVNRRYDKIAEGKAVTTVKDVKVKKNVPDNAKLA